MQHEIRPRMVQRVAKAQHFSPPSARELRAQGVHRLQVGVFGLCAMLLLVGLANIIMDRARLADKEDPPVEVIPTTAPTKKASDPLADIGVVPAADPSSTPTEEATPLP